MKLKKGIVLYLGNHRLVGEVPPKLECLISEKQREKVEDKQPKKEKRAEK